jgi:DNA processing protein
VRTVELNPEQLPQRVQALGWRLPVYLRGAPLTDRPAVAIVGARAASRVGMDRAHALGRHLSARGVGVVSGGALGIDGGAHRGALAGGGTTTVVLGSGVDVLYPARHAAMFCEILGCGGTLAGLMPDGTQPRPSLFPQRNRLIAALADLVIVVEAELVSGSMSTVAAAQSFGRPVAAWPGSAGCDRLLARGAAIVESSDDAERALAGDPRRAVPAAAIDPITQQVREAIAAGASGLDDIIRHTGLTVRAVLRALPMIERMQ